MIAFEVIAKFAEGLDEFIEAIGVGQGWQGFLGAQILE